MARKHLMKSIEWKGERVGVVEMRRHYTNYFRDLPGVKEFRAKLVAEMDPGILNELLDELKAHYQEEFAI